MTFSLVRERTEKRACERIRPASGAGGRWFESSHPDQYLQGAAFEVDLLFCPPVHIRSERSSKSQFRCFRNVGYECSGPGFVSGAIPERNVFLHSQFSCLSSGFFTGYHVYFLD